MKKIVFPGVIILFVFLMFPAPEAKAMDPVTLSLLAPVAIKAFQTASPYIIRGLTGFAKGCVKVGKDMVDFFRLPLGMGQIMFLFPFGYFKSGVRNLVLGGIAPFKLCIHTLILPVLLFGANINI